MSPYEGKCTKSDAFRQAFAPEEIKNRNHPHHPSRRNTESPAHSSASAPRGPRPSRTEAAISAGGTDTPARRNQAGACFCARLFVSLASPKILPLGNVQINLTLPSLIRIFAKTKLRRRRAASRNRLRTRLGTIFVPIIRLCNALSPPPCFRPISATSTATRG